MRARGGERERERAREIGTYHLRNNSDEDDGDDEDVVGTLLPLPGHLFFRYTRADRKAAARLSTAMTAMTTVQ